LGMTFNVIIKKKKITVNFLLVKFLYGE